MRGFWVCRLLLQHPFCWNRWIFDSFYPLGFCTSQLIRDVLRFICIFLNNCCQLQVSSKLIFRLPLVPWAPYPVAYADSLDFCLSWWSWVCVRRPAVSSYLEYVGCVLSCASARSRAPVASSMVRHANCCTIQLVHLYSTTYIYVQQDIFIFNILFLYSSIHIFFQLQPKLILYKYLFNFNQKQFYSTGIFVQLQQKLISTNNNIRSTSPKLFSFNNNNYSTSAKIIFI